MHEQFPLEIIQRRRDLVPIMKNAREKGHEAVLDEDRLYIDKRRFYPRSNPVLNQPQEPQNFPPPILTMGTGQPNVSTPVPPTSGSS